MNAGVMACEQNLYSKTIALKSTIDDLKLLKICYTNRQNPAKSGLMTESIFIK